MSSFDEVKLKIKINNGGYVEELYHHQEAPQQLRTCEVCGKQFSCGKALGGHKRIHQQLNNDKEAATSFEKKAQNQKIKIHLDADNNYLCNVCGKPFPSLKSVYGHMRCHPERLYRGMHPPSEFQKLISSPQSSTVSESESRVFDDDQVLHSIAVDNGFLGLDSVDLSESLAGFGWSSKAKRGRKAIYVEVDQITYEAVQTLMLLGQGFRDLSKKRKEHFLSAGKEKGIEVKKIRMDLISMIEDNDKSLDVYKCNTCDKTFPTHQALGGHRSSHIKLKSLVKVEDELGLFKEDEKSSLGLFGIPRGEDGENVVPSPKQHKCKICNKVFPTGQALGGHRRGTCTISPIASPEKTIIGRNIDLNMVPTGEEEAVASLQEEEEE